MCIRDRSRACLFGLGAVWALVPSQALPEPPDAAQPSPLSSPLPPRARCPVRPCAAYPIRPRAAAAWKG
eukprot:1627388-Pyramimonas_sp.AAC.1